MKTFIFTMIVLCGLFQATTDGTILFDVIKATDSENNEIPLTKAAFVGSYQFTASAENWRRFGKLLSERYDISISDWVSLFEANNNGKPTVIICDSAEECKSVT